MAALRKLLPSEANLLYQHLMRLTDDDRRLRFGGGIMSSESIERYVQAMDRRRSWTVGYFDDGQLRGVAQIVLPKPQSAPQLMPMQRPGGAEFAVSVEKPWQRRGIGTQLAGQAVVVARNRNIANLFVFCLPENTAMRALARKVGVRLVFSNGEVTGAVDLPRPDQLTLIAEFASETAAAFDRWADLVTAAAATAAPRS